MFKRVSSFKKKWLPIAALALGAATSGHAAAVYNEVGDAGQTLATAQVLLGTGSIDAIRGTLDASSADMFAIYLTAGTAFSATLTESSIAFNNFDSVLYLFDAFGRGLIANDDDGDVGGPYSTLSGYIPTVSGLYYLAVTGAGYTPVSGTSAIFPSLLGQGGNVAANPGAGPLTNWISTSAESGRYEIVLTGASAVVPEPGSLLLVGAALGAVGLIRRRKTAASSTPATV